MKSGVLVATSILLAGAAGVWWWARSEAPPTRWRTAVIARTDVRSIVSSTGTVEAVTTVEVGTQVSGIVAELKVDFNSPVRKGDLLARIDPTLLASDVEGAEARLASARAAKRRTELDLARMTSLHERSAATDQELESARAAHAVDAAEARSAEVALSRSRRNLAYTDITAPIDGVVLRRDVDVGQTVNAGFSAPTLFVLVGDLARVRVIAAVDEADIGRIATGQPVEVSVASWPDRRFPGTVGEVRLDASLQDNVVTYPVVVEVDNADGKLLPGMTATVEFEAQSASGVLCVPNAALRFRPESAPSPSMPSPTTPSPPVASAGGSEGARKGARGPSKLWTTGADGSLVSLDVKTGIRGTTCTQVEGEGVTDALEVVVGVDTTASNAASPFAAPASGGFRGGGF